MSKRFSLAIFAAAAVIIAGCSSSKHSTNLASATTTTAVAPTSTTAAPAGLQAASSASLGMIVVDSSGMTLYRNTMEVGGKFVCTGSCTTAWPPLLVPAGGTPPAAGSGLTGTVATINRPDGTTQVTYDGDPLYHFAADKQAGDSKGQGIGGVWFVLSTGATQSTSSSATGTATAPAAATAAATATPTTAAHTATPPPPAPTAPPATPKPTPPPPPAPPTPPPTPAPTMPPHPPTTMCYYPPCY
jgi:predicted lipoprotein with Yx(FWY)xxD motif